MATATTKPFRKMTLQEVIAACKEIEDYAKTTIIKAKDSSGDRTITDCLNYYKTLFTMKYQAPPVITISEKSSLKNLQKTYSDEQIKKMIGWFFENFKAHKAMAKYKESVPLLTSLSSGHWSKIIAAEALKSEVNDEVEGGY